MLDRRFLTCLVFAALTSVPARADTTFGPGAIIIPAPAVYQSDCGAVSVYGVVYNVLRANAWLASNGHGKIEVYYTLKETKASPNRCTPTNLHNGPAYTGVPSPLHSDAKWNDGCDFEIFSNSPVPVSLIANATATNTATDSASWATVNTSTKTSGGGATFPNWPSRTVADTGVVSTDVHTVRYYGGSFVINDADAPTFRKLIQGTLIANDVDGNPISFAVFKSGGTCSYGTSQGGTVNFHKANVGFTAPTPKIFTTPPPRLALLGRDNTGRTGTVSDGILQDYLRFAGLGFVGSQGCPLGGYLAANDPSRCPSPNKTGQIYDLFDFRDIMDGRLNATVAGAPVYKMFWAPHWALSGSSPNTSETTAINNIAAFLNNQRGLMAECASIESLEGTVQEPVSGIPAGQFQSCRDVGGVCSGNVTRGFTRNSGGGFDGSPLGARQNCTDPTLANGAQCFYFSNPGDSFAQTGDYRWHGDPSSASRVADWKPNTGARYRPSVQVLISGVSSLNKTLLTDATTARGMIAGDIVTRSLKDDDTAKSNILYLGNHDQNASVAGTKVVLQTLLQLGDPPIVPSVEEVARSTPIIATIAGNPALVQGSYDEITPPPSTTSILTDADAATFRFPYLTGHMRAVPTSSIVTAGTAIGGLSDLLEPVADPREGIPAVTPAGCGTNFTVGCRTIFTNTTGGLRPNGGNPVFFTTTNNTLDPILAGSATLTAATIDTLITRVHEGIETSPGVFSARLGGVDRSTVAVIGQSLVVSGAGSRPQMIYFGAADGMLHAYCGDNANGVCNGNIGKEIWAFIPRKLLPRLRFNTQRLEGSPRVVDLFGDFDGNGTKQFHTILLFHTGTGDPSLPDQQPAVYALDVSNPTTPKIVWEYATPAIRGAVDFGQGLTITTGIVQIGAATKNVAFVQTNNGGTSANAGTQVTAIDIETGTAVWTYNQQFPAPRIAASGVVPDTGVPEGAVGYDKTGSGRTTHVVVNTLYGDIYILDATTGTDALGGPLFRFGQDKKPFGMAPAIFSRGPGSLFTVSASGGYYDPFAMTLWSGPQQHIVAVNLMATTGLPFNETLPSGANGFVNELVTGDKAFSQVQIIGEQLFVTTDSSDVNQTGYGGGTDTGHLYGYNNADGSTAAGFSDTTPIVIAGGAGSIGNQGTTLIASGRDTAQRLSGTALSDNPLSTNSGTAPKVKRKLWLRTL